MRDFPTFIARMKNGNWEAAAKALGDSTHCKAMGKRCQRNMEQIKNCKGVKVEQPKPVKITAKAPV